MLTKPKWIVVNFSGGKDSTAMLLRMMELGEHIDEVICCDVGKEFPAMYRHIDKVRKIVESNDIKFTILKANYSFDYYMFEHEITKVRNGNQPKQGFAWPLPTVRWCTKTMKIGVVDKYFKELKKTFDLIQCIGIAVDEPERINKKNNNRDGVTLPLVEWGWSEQDCLNYCYSHGFDWEGLYKIFNRVSCWCCPLKSLDELRKLRQFFPDLWEELKEMDRRSWNQFRKDYSVQELEIRFDLEKEFEAQGKSIRSREFFNELKRRIA